MNDDHKLAEWLRDLEERSFDDADKRHSRDKDYYNWLDECLLSFASAIARECARICEERCVKMFYRSEETDAMAKACADAIRQRFGIKRK